MGLSDDSWRPGNSETTPARISVVNLAGQEVLSVNHSTTIDTNALSAGNYLLKISDINDKSETHKFTRR